MQLEPKPHAVLDHILRGLNPRQVEAVTHGDGPLLILAGAGSGKTTVLTRRVAYLLACGVPASAILAITFTNKAANELKHRLEELLGKVADSVWAMTFHSACARILRTEFPRIGRSGSFTIVDDQDQVRLIRSVLKELNLSEKMYAPSAVLHAISRAKDNLLDPQAYSARAETFYENRVAQVYSMYQAKLSEMNALDFDDLIMETVRLFREHEEILTKYQQKFRYILVDEYQDTNRAQYEFTKLLAAKHRNIAVVGDDDQSIYTFRGADLRNILEFEKDYPSCHVVKLEQNYRSTQTILDGAYHVIRNNYFRKEKKLWTTRGKGSPITVYAAQDGEDEARFVVNEISALAASGTNLSSFAILYRTNAQSRAFEQVLVEKGIPYTVLAGYRFFERKHIKDALSYLRLLANPRDYMAFERVVNEPPRGLGPSAVSKIVEHSYQSGLTLIEALVACDSIKGLNRSQREAARELGETLLSLAQKANVVPVHELLHEVLEKTGYRKSIEIQGTPESLSRLEDLDELLASVRVVAQSGISLQEYLESCALMSDQDVYDERKDACVLGTLHSAKGLEFDVVFLCGLEEGLLPHARSSGDEKQIEEERRLMYVGMTRARKRLYLTFAWSREAYPGPSRTRVSRFIREIPSNLLEVRTWDG